MKCGLGYTIWATHIDSRHWGRVAVAWRERAGWQVEGIVNY